MNAELEQRTHAACAQLRFAEGLRRRSAEARAEAAVQEATHFATHLGRPVTAEKIRGLSFEGDFSGAAEPCEENVAVALGVWRATWEALAELPNLNEPATRRDRRASGGLPVPQALATINRNAASFLVACGLVDLDDVAKPADPAALGEVVRLATHLNPGEAMKQIAKIWALFRTGPVFRVCSEQTGLVFVKVLLAQVGAEPTGVAILSKSLADGSEKDNAKQADGERADGEQADGEQADGDQAGGDPVRADQAGASADDFLQMVLAGAQEGEEIALHVQAGLPKEPRA